MNVLKDENLQNSEEIIEEFDFHMIKMLINIGI